MSDEVPEVARPFPVVPSVQFAHRIGQKCVVTELGEGWLCAHGTDGSGLALKTDSEDDKEIAPMGSIGIDKSQARVYIRPARKRSPGDAPTGENLAGYPASEDPEAVAIIIIGPDDRPFRASSKGRRGDSKSFADDGNPVPGVLFLYALKTGRYDDRLRALDTLPLEYWHNEVESSPGSSRERGPTFGQLFEQISFTARVPEAFERLVGRLIAESAKKSGGLSAWELWEKVADAAAEETLDRMAKASGAFSPDLDARFLQAVRETTIEHDGLPAQSHVRTRWEELANELGAGLGDDRERWKSHRRKLGFDWLPPLADWEKAWHPLLQRAAKKGR